jgi:hypothetical protein
MPAFWNMIRRMFATSWRKLADRRKVKEVALGETPTRKVQTQSLLVETCRLRRFEQQSSDLPEAVRMVYIA